MHHSQMHIHVLGSIRIRLQTSCIYNTMSPQINDDHLSGLEGKPVEFEAVDTFGIGGGGSAMHRQQRQQRAQRLLEEACPARRRLQLKPGAQVILLKTLNLGQGLVNGARGVVTGLLPEEKKVQVKFLSGNEVKIGYQKWNILNESQQTLCSREQIPLQLGWAISIHKSQGMSLDFVAVSLANIFEYGQAYVALSRARTLDGLSIIGNFSSDCIRAHPRVLEFYNDGAAAAASISSPCGSESFGEENLSGNFLDQKFSGGSGAGLSCEKNIHGRN
uniref:DNA helicase Pif1-like 2B domain-containing protein n=1 Tax=Heterosigma akashiwo TaxID=2829 RepID=A0A7S4D4C8_HETAK